MAVRAAVGRTGAFDFPAALLFLAAANRDPRRWDNPGHFDIHRRATGHVGFGFGIHACVGASLARLEGEVLLEALARQVATLEPAGQPERRLNNTLSGFASLPLRLLPAQYDAL